MWPPCVGTLWELDGRNTEGTQKVLWKFWSTKLTYSTREGSWVILVNWKDKLVNLGFLAEAGSWYSEASS